MYISIDLGGTYTRIASSYDLKKITRQEKFSTEHDLRTQVGMLQGAMTDFLGKEKLEGVCLGLPGLIDKKNKKLGLIINIPYFSNMSYSEVLGNNYPAELLIAENDAALAGLGEATKGAGMGYKVIAYLTLSTGVGGVRIVEGEIDARQRHFEPGHMIICKNGREFKLCGQRGCLSGYVSGTAFKEIYGVSPADCDDMDVWRNYAQDLSLGVSNVLAMWDPDVIVVGGSMSKKFDNYFGKPLLTELNKQSIFKVPPILKASLGDDSGLYGGFEQLSKK